MNNNIFKELINTMRQAYCPYSNFHVGCVLVTDQGQYRGFNVENAAYGNTICAERAALIYALIEGAKFIKEVHVISDDPLGKANMCGVCRQSLSEHVTSNAKVYIYAHNGTFTSFNFFDLLPESFDRGYLNKNEHE